MHSLFWRIFWAFWLAITLIVIGTVTAAVNESILHREQMPWVQRGQLFTQAAEAFKTGGLNALDQWLVRLEHSQGPYSARTYVIGPDGRDLLGRALPKPLRPFFTPQPVSGHPHAPAVPPISGALILMTHDGRVYQVVVTALHRHRLLFFGVLGLPGVAGTTIAVALVVSTVICFLLARYLVRPIERLRQAARRMAAGDLDVRVRPGLKRRQDDLARLAADFDAMAERVQGLLESKQRLLRDVSHELRSPLTRLQLALSLASRDEEVPRQLARIEREADRLEYLIARMLKLTRLERQSAPIAAEALDVGELLRGIVADVGIEADARGCSVRLNAAGALPSRGDPELLRSAFENVIRNAVRYGPAGSEVLIEAHLLEGLRITVRDRGPGVPEKDLQAIFEPFYRVDAARDREGGGEGLGLTIAARAIVRHGGHIEAHNAQGGGLLITMSLPPIADT